MWICELDDTFWKNENLPNLPNLPKSRNFGSHGRFRNRTNGVTPCVSDPTVMSNEDDVRPKINRAEIVIVLEIAPNSGRLDSKKPSDATRC